VIACDESKVKTVTPTPSLARLVEILWADVATPPDVGGQASETTRIRFVGLILHLSNRLLKN
jgi:hypothetical protein